MYTGSLYVNNNVGYCKTKRKVDIIREKREQPTWGRDDCRPKDPKRMTLAGKRRKIEKNADALKCIKEEKAGVIIQCAREQGDDTWGRYPRGTRLVRESLKK